MSIPQLSPNALIGNPSNLNPLAHATHNVFAAVAGSIAQEKTAQMKSDSVNISRKALEKAAHTEGRDGETKETLSRKAAGKIQAQ
ncbi:MAG: hypothetical protein WC156_09945 [Pedobacter sp.]